MSESAQNPAAIQSFALVGAAGFVAPRHMKAIHDTGHKLVAAVDPHDSVGVLDQYFPDTRFFTEIERFDRYLEKLRRRGQGDPVQYVSICTPNYLHDAHVRLALRLHAHAICEKPLVINPWNLDALAELEHEYARRVYTVLQLRHHPGVQALKKKIDAAPASQRFEVALTYVTRRGPWYQVSWKGSEEESGGVAMNIGIHFFDLLLWLFGPVGESVVYAADPTRMGGALELARARVKWFLSVEVDDLPPAVRARGKHAYRSITVDGAELDLSDGFGDLHTLVYREILAGRGNGIRDARPSIDLVYNVRRATVHPCADSAHPMRAPAGDGH